MNTIIDIKIKIKGPIVDNLQELVKISDVLFNVAGWEYFEIVEEKNNK